MNILLILIPASSCLAILALITFLWTLRSKQYDDLEGDAWRILLNQDQTPPDDHDQAQDSDA